MFRAIGKRLVNGFRDPGKECGFLVITIVGEIGWQHIMRIAKPRDTIRREESGSRDITDLVKSTNSFRAGLRPCPVLLLQNL
jgi:hypothetical protein